MKSPKNKKNQLDVDTQEHRGRWGRVENEPNSLILNRAAQVTVFCNIGSGHDQGGLKKSPLLQRQNEMIFPDLFAVHPKRFCHLQWFKKCSLFLRGLN